MSKSITLNELLTKAHHLQKSKVCIDCKEFLSSESFKIQKYTTKKGKKRTRLTSRCTPCYNIKQIFGRGEKDGRGGDNAVKEWKRKQAWEEERIQLSEKNLKRCKKCEDIRPISEYWVGNVYKDNLQPYCKSCWHDYKKDECEFKRFFLRKKRGRRWDFKIKPTDIPGVEVEETRVVDKKRRTYISWRAIKYPKVCPVLGVELKWGKKGTNGNNKGGTADPFSPSLDRIDSTKGYIPGNVMIISTLANIMKSNATVEQLINFSKYMLSKYGE